MFSRAKGFFAGVLLFALLPTGLPGCKATGGDSPATAAQPPFMSAVASAPPQNSSDAPPPESTGGFDGKRAYALVAKQVGFGPHPSGSPAIAQLQDFLLSELKSYGCVVETRRRSIRQSGATCGENHKRSGKRLCPLSVTLSHSEPSRSNWPLVVGICAAVRLD